MRSAHSHHEMESKPSSEVVIDLEARATTWEVAPGRTVPAWTYNGQLPGPTIEATVGDTLVVRLTNRLDEPTTIHWHGIRLPAAMDGTQVVQPLVLHFVDSSGLDASRPRTRMTTSQVPRSAS